MTDEGASRIPPWLMQRAEVYARHAIVRRPRMRSRFVRFTGAGPEDRVLDVGSGPGFGAFAFARRAQSVTALEWRPEFLEVARREASSGGVPRVTFVEGGPTAMPFPPGSFTVVASAGAVHHLASPREVFREMGRICTPGGAVAVEDVVTSEEEMRARYHNRIERLRDRSHTRLLSLSEMISLMGQAGLDVTRVDVQESVREYNEWVGVTRPPLRRSEHVRRLLQGSVEQDLSGLDVQAEDDTFFFVQRLAWVLARKRG